MSRVGGRRLAERARARLGVPSAGRGGDLVRRRIRLGGLELHQRLRPRRRARPGPSRPATSSRFLRGVRVALLSGERRTIATTGQDPFRRRGRAHKGSRDCTGCRGRRARPPFGTISPLRDSSARPRPGSALMTARLCAARALPASAALRYQRFAAAGSRATPMPFSYIEPSRYCAGARPSEAARSNQRAAAG